jgi:hypothetical protein
VVIINAWLNKPPLQRTQPAFPVQMRRYAEQRNHCLMTGQQLLNLVRTALAEPGHADDLASLLNTTTACSQAGTIQPRSSAKRRRNLWLPHPKRAHHVSLGAPRKGTELAQVIALTSRKSRKISRAAQRTKAYRCWQGHEAHPLPYPWHRSGPCDWTGRAKRVDSYG